MLKIKEEKDDKTKNVKEKTKETKPKFTFKEQKEYEVIDDEIAELEENLEKIENEMSKNASNYGKLNELMKEKEELEGKLEFKYERWEYLNEIAEAIKNYSK